MLVFGPSSGVVSPGIRDYDCAKGGPVPLALQFWAPASEQLRLVDGPPDCRARLLIEVPRLGGWAVQRLAVLLGVKHGEHLS